MPWFLILVSIVSKWRRYRAQSYWARRRGSYFSFHRLPKSMRSRPVLSLCLFIWLGRKARDVSPVMCSSRSRRILLQRPLMRRLVTLVIKGSPNSNRCTAPSLSGLVWAAMIPNPRQLGMRLLYRSAISAMAVTRIKRIISSPVSINMARPQPGCVRSVTTLMRVTMSFG